MARHPWLIVNHLTSVIGEYLLDRELVISQQREPTSHLPIVEGNRILLPYYDRIEHLVGDPHAKITPNSRKTAEYTPLFCANGDPLEAQVRTAHRWLSHGFRKRLTYETETLGKGRPFLLSASERSGIAAVRIGQVFSVELSSAPVLEKYWEGRKK